MKTCCDCYSSCEKSSPDFYNEYADRTDVYKSCPYFIDKKVIRNIKKEDRVLWRSASDSDKLEFYVVKDILKEKGEIKGFSLFRGGVFYYCDASQLGVDLFVKKKQTKQI